MLDTVTLFDSLFLQFLYVELAVPGSAGHLHRIREAWVGHLRLFEAGRKYRVIVIAVQMGVLAGEARHYLLGLCRIGSHDETLRS